eukprot:1992726-Rhodomonas_salina.1
MLTLFIFEQAANPSEDKTRARIVDGADAFVEIGHLSLPEAVAEVNKHKISLMVEMGGYTQNRLGLRIVACSLWPTRFGSASRAPVSSFANKHMLVLKLVASRLKAVSYTHLTLPTICSV